MLVLLFSGMLLAQGLGSPVVTPPQPSNTTIRNEITVTAPPPDPQVVADTFTQGSEAVFVGVIVPPAASIANDFLGLPNIWTQTPDEWSWNHPALRTLSDGFRAAALALIGLAIFAAGLRHSLNQGTNYGRLALGLLSAVGNLIWWQMGIGINNALCAAVAGDAASLPAIIQPHLQLPVMQPGPMSVGTLATAALVLVAAIVAVIVAFAMVMRLALIDVLLVVGPILLVTSGTEDSSFMAEHYTKLSIAVLFSQVAIVVGFRVAGVLAGLGSGGAISVLLACAVLWVSKDLPKTLIAGYAGSSRGGGSGIAILLLARRMLARF